MKKIYKYATGSEVPENAVYLGTVTQTLINKPIRMPDKYLGKSLATDEPQYEEQYQDQWEDCYFVWHYFLVETK